MNLREKMNNARERTENLRKQFPILFEVLDLRAKIQMVENWFHMNNQIFIQPDKWEINQMLDKKYALQKQMEKYR